MIWLSRFPRFPGLERSVGFPTLTTTMYLVAVSLGVLYDNMALTEQRVLQIRIIRSILCRN
jgi:hypothetical protein